MKQQSRLLITKKYKHFYRFLIIGSTFISCLMLSSCGYKEKMFLSQRDLMAKLGISYTTVNRLETGKFIPTIQMKKKLYSLFKKAGLIKKHNLGLSPIYHLTTNL